jgi:hypothetical protein
LYPGHNSGIWNFDGKNPKTFFAATLRASAKNNCTILLGLWPICCVALKATYLDMQPSMRLADEPNPGAIRHNYFLPRPLIDEMFAVAVGRWRHSDISPHKHWYQFGSMLFMYTNWNICTIIGLAVGRMLSDIGGWGLDFAMVAAFIGMVLPYLTNSPNYICVLVSGLSALAFNGMPHKLGLILATLLGICASVFAEKYSDRRARATVPTTGNE